VDVLVQRVVEGHQLRGVAYRPLPPPLAKGIVQAALWLDPAVVNTVLLAWNRRLLHPRDGLIGSEL